MYQIRLSKNLIIKSQSLWIGPMQVERAFVGDPEQVLGEIIAIGAYDPQASNITNSSHVGRIG